MHCLPHGVYTCDKASARHTGYYRQKKPCGFPWSAVQHPFNCLIKVTCLRSCHDSTDLHLRWVILVWISFPLVNIKSSVCMWNPHVLLPGSLLFFLINADFIANLLPLISNLGKYTTTWGWLVHRTQPRDLKTFQKEVRSCSVWDIDWHASSDSSYPGEVHHPVIFANPLWKGPSEEMQINWEQHICFLETIGNNTGNIFQSFFTVLPLPKRTPLYTDSLQNCSSSA